MTIITKPTSMKYLVYFLILGLIIWIAGSSYCYVCEIRGDCRKAADIEAGSEINMADTAALAPDTVMDEVPVAGNETLEYAEEYVTKHGKEVVYFGFASGEAPLDSSAMDYIEQLSYYIQHHPEKKILITGHSDSRGTPEGNMKYSLLRAQYIQGLFEMKGVAPSAFIIEGKSDREPMASNDTEEGRQKNRRAEITIK